MRKSVKVVMFLLSMSFLGGCDSAELEQRSFPLAMGIDVQMQEPDENLVITYDFPDLKQISEKSKTADTPMGFSLEGKDLYHIEKSYENNTNRILDYNHLKSIIISEENFENMQKIRGLLENWEDRPEVARNTSLFFTSEKAAEILDLTEKTEGSVGKYLEEMLESQKDFRADKVATIGELMNQWHNQDELLLVPVLTEQGEQPAITQYGVISNFEYVGDISVETAMEVFLSQNLLKHFEYECEDGTVIEINNMRVEREIQEEAGIPVVKNIITGKGKISQSVAMEEGERYRLEKQVAEQLTFQLTKTANELQEKLGIDMTNSYIALGGYQRNLYEKYKDMPKTYGKDVRHVFQTEVTILNFQ